MSDTNQSNETRPLLCHDPLEILELSDQIPTDLEAIVFQSDAQTPLPKVQLAPLCLLRTLDSMCFFQIFPYTNQSVSDLHVTDDPCKVGFYSLFDQANSEIRLHRKARLPSVNCWQFIHGDTSLVS